MIFTARITYCGPLKTLDISRGSGSGDGLAFAPSWGLLHPFIANRKELQRQSIEAKALAEPARSWALEKIRDANEQLWEQYRRLYTAEMRVSFGALRPSSAAWGELETLAAERGTRPWNGAWKRLLAEAAKKDVVLLCWCGKKEADRGHCHRVLLASEILPKLGLVYGGEVPPEFQPATLGGRIVKGKQQ